jgi:hypothetical protein
MLYSKQVEGGSARNASVRLDGYRGRLTLGGMNSTTRGEIMIYGGTGREEGSHPAIHLQGAQGNLRMGGQESGVDGDILLYPKARPRTSDRNASISLDADGGNLRMGGLESRVDGDIFLFPDDRSCKTTDNASIHLNANTGDIVLRNADCAEEFDIEGGEAEPGTVMVLGDEGRLRPGASAYDKRVAGIVSGAREYKPALILDRQPATAGRAPIALMGKAYCKVDARSASVEVGDLLTTSPTPGHAMKAGDPARAFGAVIGKALRPLETGTGMIPVLIALQ